MGTPHLNFLYTSCGSLTIAATRVLFNTVPSALNSFIAFLIPGMMSSNFAALPFSTSASVGHNSVGTGDLRDIIAQKERELQEINEFRLRNLESACAEKVGPQRQPLGRASGEQHAWRTAYCNTAGPRGIRVKGEASPDQGRFSIQPQGAHGFLHPISPCKVL
jgi:hypothetical protein